jgi:peptidoglycan/xylan/chitin deacetylase (PgdA/CDA1 family)
VTPSIVFTVDVEPDDQWAPRLADGNYPPFTFANTRGMGALVRFFRERDAPATWMTSYSIARDPESADLLLAAAAEGNEIGGHLHGWETPPFAPFDRRARPFIYEYDEELRLAKHQALVAAHEEAFGTRPESYRAGRWGVDAVELRHIAELGYTIDTSVAPGIDFRDRFGLEAPGPDFRGEERADGPRLYRIGALWEVPASLARVGGELLWVRPLKHPVAQLVAATRALLRMGVPIVNVMFHSSEAFAGTSPISRREEDVQRLHGDLDAILTAAREEGAVARTLRDATDAFDAS